MGEYFKIGDVNFAMEVKASKAWCSKVCYFCGKHIKENDEIALVVVPSNLRFNGEYKKMKSNQVVHLDELKKFSKDMTNVKEVVDAMEKHKVKKENLTKEQDALMNVFIKASYAYDFKDATKKKDGIVVCKKYGSSDTIQYNVYTDTIEYYNRRKRELFDSFIEKQIVTNIYNKFHELLNDNKHSDYNALKSLGECVSNAIKTTNEMMNN